MSGDQMRGAHGQLPRSGRAMQRTPRLGTVALYALVFTILIFLLLPTAIVAPMSLNGEQFLAFPPRSWSIKWYVAFFKDPDWIAATVFSLQIAVLTTIAATLIGTCAALALVRGEIVGLGWLNIFALAPMIVPHIVLAVAMYLEFARLGLTGTVFGFVAAHTVLAVPYVVLTVSAALYRLDPAVEMAALNLGASRLAAFFRVTLPLILPGVATGAAFAFVVSLDEAVVSFFLSGVTGKTLTRKLFEDIDYSLSPIVAAASTLLVVLSVVVMGGIELFRRAAQVDSQASIRTRSTERVS